MGVQDVKRQINQDNLPLRVIEFDVSTATVDLAAQALGVEPGRIAKTMAFGLKDKAILVVAKGDAKIDNRKFKDTFGEKARMLSPAEVEAQTGHPVGGVCPFGLSQPIEVYLDRTLQEFDFVFPAGGSANSAIRITPDYLQQVTKGCWVDVCKASMAG